MIMQFTDRHVGLDEENCLVISTVNIAMNWYETMVFAFLPGSLVLDFRNPVYTENYETKKEAQKGHDRAVKMARKGHFKSIF